MTLTVEESNPVAARLYRSAGWRETGETVATRSGPAHVLRLDLAPWR